MNERTLHRWFCAASRFTFEGPGGRWTAESLPAGWVVSGASEAFDRLPKEGACALAERRAQGNVRVQAINDEGDATDYVVSLVVHVHPAAAERAPRPDAPLPRELWIVDNPANRYERFKIAAEGVAGATCYVRSSLDRYRQDEGDQEP